MVREQPAGKSGAGIGRPEPAHFRIGGKTRYAVAVDRYREIPDRFRCRCSQQQGGGGDLDRAAGDEVREIIGGDAHRQRGVQRAVQQPVQHAGEFLAQAEQSDQGRALQGRRDRAVFRFDFQTQAVVLLCGIADVHDHVADGLVVELPEAGGQFHFPRADRAGALERHVALVAEVEFENAGIVLRGAGRNDDAMIELDRNHAGRIQRRLETQIAAGKRQGCADVGERAGDAWNGQPDGLDLAAILPGVEQIEAELGDAEIAGGVLPEIEQRGRRDLQHRERLRDLGCAIIGLDETALHVLEIAEQHFAGHQAALGLRPVGLRQQDCRVVVALETVGLFGEFRHRVGAAVGLAIGCLQRRRQPGVERDIAEARGVEIGDLLVLRDRLVVNGQGLLRACEADIGADQLRVDLGDVLARHVDFMLPAFAAALVARHQARGGSQAFEESSVRLCRSAKL